MSDAPTPGLLRRFTAMLYEGVLLSGIAFVATSLFQFASGNAIAAGSWQRNALQAYLLLVFAAYFLWCWLRGGQTLAMKAWRLRVVARDGGRLSPRAALLRFGWACLGIGGCGLGLGWALFDRDRQFLHDRLAGTRLTIVEEQRVEEERG